jgi:phosphoenolpyruvate-protein kinase (PTS system EI component)
MADSLHVDFKRELEALATIRDELRLKAHLAKNDVKSELTELEQKLLRLREELQRTKTHAQSDLGAISEASRSLLQDLKRGFANVKNRLG